MPTQSLSRRVSRFFPLAVFLVASLAYVNTWAFDYAWDDKLVITANDYTKMGVQGLRDIFTKRVSVVYKSEYRPVPQAMYAVEYQVFHGSPHAGHVFNVLWYGLTCAVVYWFTRFVFGRFDERFCLLVALLFAVHPLHVEVVANIKSRDEILALFFGLSSVMLVVKAIEQMRVRCLLAGVFCFACACLSKSNAVTLLPLVALVAWYRSEGLKVSRRLAICLSGIVVSSAALAALIRHLQNTVSSDITAHLNSTVLNNIFLWTNHSETIVPTSLVIIARYLKLFLFPYPLIHLYGYDQIPLSRWGDAGPWLVIAGLAGLAAAIGKTWRRKLPLAFGVLFFASTYSVYSNLMFYAPDTMADRYMFAPSVGLAILAAYGVFALVRIGLKNAVVNGARAKNFLAGLCVILMAYFVTTVSVNRDWKNDSSLIYNRIRYMQRNAAAQAIYGLTLNRESYTLQSPEARHERRAAAMEAYAEAIRIYPDFQAAWLEIGKLFAEAGDYKKAELALIKAQRLGTLNSDSYFYLGALYLAEQDLDLATPYLEKAVLLDPKGEEAYVMLGKSYLQGNNLENLASMTATARKWFPGNIDLEALQATYFFRTRDYSQALRLAKDIKSKAPQNILALAILSSPMIQDMKK